MVTASDTVEARGLRGARPEVWYTAAVIGAAVILQPALVYYIFGRLRDTLIAGLVSACCLGYLALRHQEAKAAWLRWPLLAYVALSLPGAAAVAAQGGFPHVWVMWALAPAALYFLTVETAWSADAVLLLRRVIGLLALVEGASAGIMMIATAGVGWLTVVSTGAAFDAESLRFNVWRYASESPTAALDPRLLFINGTFEQSAALSMFLALALPSILWLAARERSAPWRRLWNLTMLLSLIIIVLYFQRGVWLATLAGMAVAGVADRQARRWFGGVMLLVAVSLALIPDFRIMVVDRIKSSGTVVGRLENYSKAIALWEVHPLFGVGYGQYNARIAEVGGQVLNPHNDYLLHLAEEGVVGLAVYLGVYAVAASNLLRLRRLLGSGSEKRARDGRFAATMGLATLAIYAVSVATTGGQTALGQFLILMALWEAESRQSARALARKPLAPGAALTAPSPAAT